MKILVIIFCLMSIRPVLGMNDRSPPHWSSYFPRRLPSYQYQRVNPDLGRLILLKNFLQLDCLKSVFYKNCQTDFQYQKPPPLTRRFGTMSAFRNISSPYTFRHPMTNNRAQTKYFTNPKIIILPPLKHGMRISNNYQNQKGVNFTSNLPQYFRTVSKDKKKTTHTKKEESFGKGIYEQLANTKNSKPQENKTVISGNDKVPRTPVHLNPVKPSTVPYSGTTFNLFGMSRLNSTETYEVEEIIEDTMSIEKGNFEKMKMGERTNEMKNISNDKQQQEVIDNSIITIIKGLTGSETSAPPTEKVSSIISQDTERKASVVQIKPSTKFQKPMEVLAPDRRMVINNRTTVPSKTPQIFKEFPNRRIVQHPDWLLKKKPDNGQGALKPLNKMSEVTPSVTTDHLTYATSHDEKKQTTEVKKFEKPPYTFFGFFNKGARENAGQKPAAIPKRLNLDSFTLSTAPSSNFENLFSENQQNLVRNDLKLEKNEPLSSTMQSILQSFTTPLQVENKTLPTYARAWSVETLEPVNHIVTEVKTTPSTTFQDRKGAPLTISDSFVHTSDPTTPNVKEFSDGPLSIDLLTTTVKPELRKDQESIGKNSRKMHFHGNTQKGVPFNQITERADLEPRRSDILITDYMDDYKDSANRVSTLSYLERMKPEGVILSDNFLTNNNIDSYIPLIPEILNDVRENKISREDLSLLSLVFGKYWPSILTLSNNTELDVLPLLTMKTEEDLMRVLESSNEFKTVTTETVDVKHHGKGSPEQAYDYVDEYTDMYDYVSGQELGEKKNAHRRKRDDELEYQKLEASKEYFESLEEEQRDGRMDYMVEYAFYDASLEEENPSVLEMIKPADLYVPVQNETFQEQIKVK